METKTRLEIKEYNFSGIKIQIQIDYIKEEISVMEYTGISYLPKKFIFAGRGIEFIDGWKNILSSLNNAINEAYISLKEYKEERSKETIKFIIDHEKK